MEFAGVGGAYGLPRRDQETGKVYIPRAREEKELTSSESECAFKKANVECCIEFLVVLFGRELCRGLGRSLLCRR